MGKIVRLTESDLTRIIRRVINEGGEGSFDWQAAAKSVSDGRRAYNTITDAIEGMGTDEEEVLAGVLKIKTAQDYQDALKLFKAEGYNTIMAYIATDMEYRKNIAYDRDQAAYMYYPYEQEQRNMLTKMEAHLKKFSSAEKIVTTDNYQFD